jgi:hypothetical protein
MRILTLELGGSTGRWAKINRIDDQPVNYIRVELITPTEHPRYGQLHTVQADCESDIWSMAELLQQHLDGCRGTNSMIHDCYRELCRFAD